MPAPATLLVVAPLYAHGPALSVRSRTLSRVEIHLGHAIVSKSSKRVPTLSDFRVDLYAHEQKA